MGENLNVLSFNIKSWEHFKMVLDSGCSKHMTEDKSLFTHFTEVQDGRVTFSDGNSTGIVGKGTVEVPGIPKLNDVLYVKGLKHNLISISQICDKGYGVHFVKDKYEIKDKQGRKTFVVGLRTSDNYYIIEPTKDNLRTCLISHSEKTTLWHQRLGHLRTISSQSGVTKWELNMNSQLLKHHGKWCGRNKV